MRSLDFIYLSMPLWVGTRHALRFTPETEAPAAPSTDALLLESGFYLLLETSGDRLLLE